MPNVAVGNTAVTEVVGTVTSFTPASGVEMVVNIQAGTSASVDISQGGTTSNAASAGSSSITSEITVLLDDSMTVTANGAPVVVTGFVIDS